MALDMINFMEDFITEPQSTFNENSQLGAGCYASVFDSDMPNMVVKVSRKTVGRTNNLSDGWLVWAIHCMNRLKNGSLLSFMPNIHGLVINYDTGEFHAVMERLSDSKRGEGPMDGKPYIVDSFGNLIKKPVSDWNDCTADGKIRRPKSLLKEFLAINEFFIANDYSSAPLIVDAHCNNWMWRAGEKRHTLVLTDPFTCQSTVFDDDGFEYRELITKMAEGNPNIKIITESK